MARNAIQFQDGLSLSGFLKRYGSEEQCEDAVRRWRWPDGFRCPKCGERERTASPSATRCGRRVLPILPRRTARAG